MDLSFVLWDAGRCGGTKVIFEVANGLVNRRHNVKIVAPKPQNWFPLKAEFITSGDIHGLTKAIPESDVVTATYCWTAYFVDAVKGRRGIPAYYCQHYEPLFFIDAKSKAEARKTYQLPINLIANSPWLKMILKETENRDSQLIIPAVDHKVFKAPKRKPKNKVQKVLAYANYSPIKGYCDVTLPALNYAWRHHPEFEVHTFGAEIPHEHKFPHVHHRNLSDKELCKLYAGCDLYVSGSYSESSPLPHLEAMASGCPVLTTSVGTEHYGGGLERVRPRAPRELGVKIVGLLKNPVRRAEMRARGLCDVRQFTWEKTVDGVECFFKDLVGE